MHINITNREIFLKRFGEKRQNASFTHWALMPVLWSQWYILWMCYSHTSFRHPLADTETIYIEMRFFLLSCLSSYYYWLFGSRYI